MRQVFNIVRKPRGEPGAFTAQEWATPFAVLRRKWKEVPAANARVSTDNLVSLADDELLHLWQATRREATTGVGFSVRGWYHLLYQDILRGKRVLDVGSGFGIDALTFAQHGAVVTCLDIVESNLTVLRRLCRMLGLRDVSFLYMHDLGSLEELEGQFDVIWCQGSLINAPFDVIRNEVQELLKFLPAGGRWIELAYPKARWEKEGRLPFDKWGDRTDGGAPWMEWYDLDKVAAMLSPAKFDVVLHFNFHDDEFNWFDLVRSE